jgi:hypothetical protein
MIAVAAVAEPRHDNNNGSEDHYQEHDRVGVGKESN